MKRFQVKGQMKLSNILVGEHLANVSTYLPDAPLAIITDERIKELYGEQFPKAPVITMGLGEKNKTLATVESLLRQLIELGCDRSWFILGIGGGIVCDVTGFVASVFLRGVGFGFVSTSLLSQVDASVGGKNGVNLDAYKNMVGVFNQPDFVICDMDMLRTLPGPEISNGLAEIVKHALISDASMLEFIEQNRRGAMALDKAVISRLVSDSVAIKSAIVQEDEKEAGERRKLNFGHTLGHAIEKIEQKGHGRAVALGMHAAALFSLEKGMIPRMDVDRIVDLTRGLGLPTALDYPAGQIMAAAARDKKKQGSDLHFVFLGALGKALVRKISYEEMNTFIRSTFIR